MRMKTATLWTLLAGALMLSPLATAQVHVSEIHYDNAGTDSGEAIEISSPAGTDLSGWQIVLYNGTNGASYDTDALTGLVPALCGDRQVVVRDYPSNGIQNGAPDAIALVDSGGTVVEFLSYEGALVATNGPAAGLTAIDIGVSEAGTEKLSGSVSRFGTVLLISARSTDSSPKRTFEVNVSGGRQRFQAGSFQSKAAPLELAVVSIGAWIDFATSEQ